ncbi:MAG TPA: hypothetical protein VGH87_10710 [Polyangiaceae bacterium]
MGLGALAACTTLTGSSVASNTVSTFSPVTTVEVDSTTLFDGFGCSDTAGVPYKYVATIYPLGSSKPIPIGDTVIRNAVSDCFANAVFEDLPNATGEGDFTLKVDVFDLPTWNANQGSIDFGDPTQEAAIRAVASWTTDCTAHQTSNIQSLAVCDPLQK